MFMDKKLPLTFTNLPHAKKALQEYYSAFDAAFKAAKPYVESRDCDATYGEAGWVTISPKMLRYSHQCADLIIRKLGVGFKNERDIMSLIQNEAHEAASKKNTVQHFIEAVEHEINCLVKKDLEIFLPNYAVGFESRMTNFPTIKIGNVRIISLCELQKEIQGIIDDVNEQTQSNSIKFDCGRQRIVDGALHRDFPSAPIMWAVKPRASQRSLKEEAIWQIGVALSLIRCSMKTLPPLKTVELNPVSLDHLAELDHLCISELKPLWTQDKFLGHGNSVYRQYDMSRMYHDLMSEKKQTTFRSIFEAQPETLGERVFNALGWLAKGRQAEDRTIRLLHFFTAIESILTGTDKNARVTETIAQRGSVVLASSLKHRAKVAKELKEHYNSRSDAIHRGSRDVSELTVERLHYLAQVLVDQVIERCDMSQKHKEFCDTLSEAD